MKLENITQKQFVNVSLFNYGLEICKIAGRILKEETKNDDYFQVVGIKVFLDGVYEALTEGFFFEFFD